MGPHACAASALTHRTSLAWVSCFRQLLSRLHRASYVLLSLHRCRWADGETEAQEVQCLCEGQAAHFSTEGFCALEYSPLCLSFSCLPFPPSSFSFRLEMKGKEQRKLRPLSALETTDSQTRQSPGSVYMQNSTPESLNPSL